MSASDHAHHAVGDGGVAAAVVMSTPAVTREMMLIAEERERRALFDIKRMTNFLDGGEDATKVRMLNNAARFLYLKFRLLQIRLLFTRISMTL